jgi:hypothetical protein
MRTFVMSCFFLVIVGNALVADMPRSWNPRLKVWKCTAMGGDELFLSRRFQRELREGINFRPE